MTTGPPPKIMVPARYMFAKRSRIKGGVVRIPREARIAAKEAKKMMTIAMLCQRVNEYLWSCDSGASSARRSVASAFVVASLGGCGVAVRRCEDEACDADMSCNGMLFVAFG